MNAWKEFLSIVIPSCLGFIAIAFALMWLVPAGQF